MVLRLSVRWLSVVGSLLIGCGPQPSPLPPAPAPAEPPPAAPAEAPMPAASSAASASSSAAPAASAPVPGGGALRPFNAPMLADDVGARFAQRAWLKRRAPLRVRLDEAEPSVVEPQPPSASSIEMVVVEQREGAVRFVLESERARLLLWAEEAAFDRVPVAPTRLALRPGEMPKGPPGMQGGDQVGVWLLPGAQISPQRRRDGWAEIEVSDGSFQGRGWLDESALGAVYETDKSFLSGSSASVLRGTRLVASPGGAMLGKFLPSTDRSDTRAYWITLMGAAPKGFVHVRYAGFTFFAQGLVPEFAYEGSRGSMGRGFGRMGMRRHVWGNPPPALSIPAGTVLYDDPVGAQVGIARKVVALPDRLGKRVDRGRRLIEVPTGEVGLVRVWVDEQAVGPYVPEPPPQPKPPPKP